MGFQKIISLFLLITSAVVIAQENKLGFGLNDLSSFNPESSLRVPRANISSIRKNIFQLFNGFAHLPTVISPLRQKRSESDHKEYNEKHSVKNNSSLQGGLSARSSASGKKNNQRLSVITRIRACDYANQPGSRCLSCREAITCYRNNRAIVRRCFFILRYCNNGRCSSTPGRQCYRTSSTTTTTVTPSSTSTSTHTSTATSASNTTYSGNSTLSSTTSTSNTTTPTSATVSTSITTSPTAATFTTVTSSTSSSAADATTTPSSESTSPTSAGSDSSTTLFF